MARARNEVGLVDTADIEELLRHACERRRPEHLQVPDLAGALVPARQDHARVVPAVVVVQVGEEEVGDVGGLDAELEQAVVRAKAVIEHQHIRADLDDITRALPAQRGGWRAGPKQSDAHVQVLGSLVVD